MAFTTDDLKQVFELLAARMASERDALCALDGEIGDGDHGIAMEQGMKAAADQARAAAAHEEGLELIDRALGRKEQELLEV